MSWVLKLGQDTLTLSQRRKTIRTISFIILIICIRDNRYKKMVHPSLFLTFRHHTGCIVPQDMSTVDNISVNFQTLIIKFKKVNFNKKNLLSTTIFSNTNFNISKFTFLEKDYYSIIVWVLQKYENGDSNMTLECSESHVSNLWL